MTTARIAVTTIASVVLFAGLCVGGWFLYWFLAHQNTAQQYDVNTGTQQYQASLISQERDRVTGWAAATDDGQKKLIASQFCAVYDTITRVPADLADAHNQICE